jgi:hypothetical protein
MPRRKTTEESVELWKPPSESWNLALKWVALLAAHFRVEMSEPEIQVYCDSLGNKDPQCLNKAMQRCLNECEFMPRLKDINDRMPEPQKAVEWGDFVPVSEHVEPYTETHQSRVFIDKNGYRRVRIEPKP